MVSFCPLLNLSEDVAHQILSLLPIKDLFRFCLASKKCQELCISMPSLVFDNTIYKDDSLLLVHRPNFVRFLTKFMDLRHDSGEITLSFHLRWSFKQCFVGEILFLEKWFFRVTNPKLVHVDISLFDLYDDQILWLSQLPIVFPYCLFTSGSLRSIKLDANAEMGILEFPYCSSSSLSSFAGFKSIQEMSIMNVRIVDEKFCDLLSTSFTSLKKLGLHDIHCLDNIDVSSSSLETLVVVNQKVRDLCSIKVSGEKLNLLYVRWYSKSSSGSKSLEVSAPNLKKLYLSGNLLYRCVLMTKELMSLRFCGIYFTLPSSISRTMVPDMRERMLELLQAVNRTNTLRLTTYFIKVLFRLGCLPSPLFTDLEKLFIDIVFLYDDEVPALAAFLKGLPNLKALRVRCASIYKHKNSNAEHEANLAASGENQFNLDYWESQNLNFVHRLKGLIIELPAGSRNEFELLKYLLKNGENLENVMIFYEAPLSTDRRKEIKGYKKPSTSVRYYP